MFTFASLMLAREGERAREGGVSAGFRPVSLRNRVGRRGGEPPQNSSDKDEYWVVTLKHSGRRIQSLTR